MRKTRAWVSKDFHNMLKKKAIEEDMNVLRFTDKVAKEQMFSDIEFFPTEKKKKKRLIL